jgi:MoaA/NifB/PqqE/SkfB family radical SAM enzyme
MTISVFRGTRRGIPVFDNTRRGARILGRVDYYAKISASALGRIPVSTMLRSHFTWAFPEQSRPAYVTVEFTNHCNLRCPYCTSPLGLRERGFMAEETFERVTAQVQDLGVPRVRILGDGEPTLHPRFATMVTRLASSCRYVQMVTNAQRLRDETIEAIFSAPVRLLEVSVDSNHKIGYERSRIGGSFGRLLSNLTALRNAKKQMKAPTLVGIRAMIRPSELAHEREILRFWRPYADVVIPQYVTGHRTRGADPDSFPHHHEAGLIPRCNLPSKVMIVHWNGKVPICEYSQRQTGIPDGVVVGDVRQTSLREIWNSQTFNDYRRGHRERRSELTPICRGCLAQ